MIIFKDILTGDEMFTDSSKYKLLDGCLYEVLCQHITRTQGEIQIDGANPSTEEVDEGTDTAVESGIDLVLNHHMVETSFNRKDYMNYLKTYTKALQEKWKQLGHSDEEISDRKAKITEAVKKVIPRVSECQFFLGESFNPDGMVALLDYKSEGGDEKPYMYFFKHGLEEMKVLADDSLKNERYYLRDRNSGVEFFLHLLGDCKIHLNNSLMNELDQICANHGKECLERLALRTSLLPLFSFDVLTPGPALIGRKTSKQWIFLNPEPHPIGIDLQIIHARITDGNEAKMRLALIISWEDNRVCTPLKNWRFTLMDSQMTDKISTPNIQFLNKGRKLSGCLVIKSQVYTDETISTGSGHRLFAVDDKIVISKPAKITLEEEWIVKVPCEPFDTDYPFEKMLCPLTLYNSMEFTCLYLLNAPNLSSVDVPDWTISLLSIKSSQKQYFMYSRTPALYFKFKFIRSPFLSLEIWSKSIIGLIITSGSYLFRHFLSNSVRLYHLLFGIFTIISLQVNYSKTAANKFSSLSLFDIWMVICSLYIIICFILFIISLFLKRSKPKQYSTQARLNQTNEEILHERHNIIFDSISYIVFSFIIVICLFSVIFLYVKSNDSDINFEDNISKRRLFNCRNQTSGFGSDYRSFNKTDYFLTKKDLEGVSSFMYDIDELQVKPNEFECRPWVAGFHDYVHYYLNNRECFQNETGAEEVVNEVTKDFAINVYDLPHKMVITSNVSLYETNYSLIFGNFSKPLLPVIERMKSMSQKIVDIDIEREYLRDTLDATKDE